MPNRKTTPEPVDNRIKRRNIDAKKSSNTNAKKLSNLPPGLLQRIASFLSPKNRAKFARTHRAALNAARLNDARRLETNFFLPRTPTSRTVPKPLPETAELQLLSEAVHLGLRTTQLLFSFKGGYPDGWKTLGWKKSYELFDTQWKLCKSVIRKRGGPGQRPERWWADVHRESHLMTFPGRMGLGFVTISLRRGDNEDNNFPPGHIPSEFDGPSPILSSSPQYSVYIHLEPIDEISKISAHVSIRFEGPAAQNRSNVTNKSQQHLMVLIQEAIEKELPGINVTYSLPQNSHQYLRYNVRERVRRVR